MSKRVKRGERERKDIVSGEILPEAHLIRFVVGPESRIVPDLTARLPGRGIWVEASQEALEQAVEKRLFARAAKQAVQTPDDLVETVRAGLKKRVQDALGLAAKSGLVVTGFEKIRSEAKYEEPAIRFAAYDSGADGRSKLAAVDKALEQTEILSGQLSAAELGAALGRESCVHVLVKTGDGARKLETELGRLSGFVPRIPPEWAD